MNEIERLQHLAGIRPVHEADHTEAEPIDNGPNDEVESIKKDLYQLGKYCVELHKMLSSMDNTDFPHWWQAKIVKAKDYISTAKHYLENEAASDQQSNQYTAPAVSPNAEDFTDPSGVS